MSKKIITNETNYLEEFIKDLKLSFQIYFIKNNNYNQYINVIQNEIDNFIKDYLFKKINNLEIKQNFNTLFELLLK